MCLLKVTDIGVVSIVAHLGIVENFPQDMNQDKFQIF